MAQVSQPGAAWLGWELRSTRLTAQLPGCDAAPLGSSDARPQRDLTVPFRAAWPPAFSSQATVEQSVCWEAAGGHQRSSPWHTCRCSRRSPRSGSGSTGSRSAAAGRPAGTSWQLTAAGRRQRRPWVCMARSAAQASRNRQLLCAVCSASSRPPGPSPAASQVWRPRFISTLGSLRTGWDTSGGTGWVTDAAWDF